MNEFSPKLRGNTFLILLLRAAKNELSAKPTWRASASGLTRANLFETLIKVMVSSFEVTNGKTLTKYIPDYLRGKRPFSKDCYPFNRADFITKAKRRFNTNGQAALSAMKKFCDKYLSADPSDLGLLVWRYHRNCIT